MSSTSAPRRARTRSFYAAETDEVARKLLGAILVSIVDGQRVEGRIVETEAYLGPHDPASHAAKRIGRTARNRSMFGPPGTAYVYRIYGVHWCLNAVTMREDFPAAVLIRAVEPVAGIDVMRQRRWPTGIAGPDRLIASGPGKLAAAFGITGALDGHDLRKPPLFVVPGTPVAPTDITIGPRIGITRATEWPLRFCVRASAWISHR